MPEKYISIEFQVRAQNYTNDRFTIPKKIVDLLELDEDTKMILEITSAKGTTSYLTTTKSGPEIYSLKNHVGKSESIRVRISYAPENR